MKDTVFYNLDADATFFFEKELEHNESEARRVEFPEYKYSKFFPVTDEAGPAAEVIRYEMYESVGLAAILANYSDDLPQSDVIAKEYFSPVKPVGSSYSYSIIDVRRSAKTGKSLDREKAISNKMAHEKVWNDVAWYGDAKYGLKGFLYNGNSSTIDPTTGAGGDTWDLKTGLEILADLNYIVDFVFDLTKGVENVTNIILPQLQYSKISSTPLQPGSDTTILQYFLRNRDQIVWVDSAYQLKNVDPAPSGGAAPIDCAVGYAANPRKLKFHIPQGWEQLPPQPHNFKFKVPTHSRVGDVAIYYPLSIAIMEDI